MKKLYTLISLFACLLIATACENDDKLSDTRVPDKTLPTVTLGNISIENFEASFHVNVTNGNPEILEYGILLSESSQPTLENSTLLTGDVKNTDVPITCRLIPGTTYYVSAYALTSNKLITSDSIEKFTTDPHPLGAFLGNKTFSGYSLHKKAESSLDVSLSFDPENPTVAYLLGLGSEAGVSLPFNELKLVFDLEKGTVTIPENQVVKEPKYGDYCFFGMDDESNVMEGDIVGTIEGDTIKFHSLAVLIVGQTNNQGLYHFAYYDIVIE